MKITICIGSACHVKGSRQIVEQLQYLVAQNHLKEQIELAGSFCMGNCEQGVSVKIDDELFSLQPDGVNDFFQNEVLPRLNK